MIKPLEANLAYGSKKLISSAYDKVQLSCSFPMRFKYSKDSNLQYILSQPKFYNFDIILNSKFDNTQSQ